MYGYSDILHNIKDYDVHREIYGAIIGEQEYLLEELISKNHLSHNEEVGAFT
jgi:hypothetical protein